MHAFDAAYVSPQSVHLPTTHNKINLRSLTKCWQWCVQLCLCLRIQKGFFINMRMLSALTTTPCVQTDSSDLRIGHYTRECVWVCRWLRPTMRVITHLR